jgi:hypothetical protein
MSNDYAIQKDVLRGKTAHQALSKHCVYLSVLILSLDAVAFYNRGDRTLGKIRRDRSLICTPTMEWQGQLHRQAYGSNHPG